MVPLVNMGQEPTKSPDVNGWELARTVLHRVDAVTDQLRGHDGGEPALEPRQRASAGRIAGRRGARVEYHLVAPQAARRRHRDDVRRRPSNHLRVGGALDRSEAQLANKASGLGRLIVGSAEYQF